MCLRWRTHAGRGMRFDAEVNACRGSWEGPKGRGSQSVRGRQCEPVPLPCVDVGNEIAAEDRHSLPPRTAAQFYA